MRLSPEMEAKGLQAYEQARAFERLKTGRLQASYALFLSMPALIAVVEWRLDRTLMVEASGVMCVFLLVVSWLHWRRLNLRYEVNLRLLEELHAKYGDDLPWLQVERHLEALEKLKRELAEEAAQRRAV